MHLLVNSSGVWILFHEFIRYPPPTSVRDTFSKTENEYTSALVSGFESPSPDDLDTSRFDNGDADREGEPKVKRDSSLHPGRLARLKLTHAGC